MTMKKMETRTDCIRRKNTMSKPELILRADADRSEWMETRKLGIGGSDCATVLGLNPYQSAYTLAAERLGMVEPDDLSKNPRVWFGTALEPIVAARFEDLTGKKVHRRGTLRDPDHPYMLANIDRWVEGEKVGLEIKTADARMARFWGDKDDFEDPTVPDGYYCQCMHYMAVTGAPYWYLAVLIGGNDYRCKVINRNEEEIEYIRREEGAFWDMRQKRELPPIDGTASTGATIEKLHSRASAADIPVLEDPYAMAALSAYWEAKAAEKTAKEAEQDAKNKLMNLIGDNEMVFIDNGKGDRFKVTWKNQSRETLSLSKLKKSAPSIYKLAKEQGLITISSSRIMRIPTV